MDEPTGKTKGGTARGRLKAGILILFLVLTFLVFRHTPLRQYLDPAVLRELVGSFGGASPLVFILAYAAGITMFLPATLFTGIGAILFGTFKGFIFNLAGAMLGAATSFWVGRHLGRDFAASLIGDRLQKYDQKIANNGFATVLYLRLVFFPFTPLNFGLGLTRVSFNQYFWGTFFGIIAGGFIMTFFFATLSEVWESGQWEKLLGWKTIFSLLLFAASFFIPKIAKKIFNFDQQRGNEMKDLLGQKKPGG
jgi:uncharacterized membrane protein YdjX (TVP38/TMEM64 family)